MALLSKKRKRFIAGLLTAAAVGIALCLISNFNLLHGIQLQSSDFLFKAANLNPGTDLDKNIIIVAIDDKSLEQLGRFQSWPRSYHANLINVLAEAEARVIVFDVLFSEPSSDDERLAASIKSAGNVILPRVCTLTVSRSTVTGEAISFENIIKPLETFEENALAVGHANILPDEDGVVRRLPLLIPTGEYHEPALSLAAVAKYLRRSHAIESPAGDNFLPFAGRSISIDGTNSMLINYTGDSAAPLSFKTVSYVDALRGDITPAVFRDNIVVIGVTASGLGDTFWTPMGRMTSGVELHASAMHTILTGNFLKPSPSSFTIVSILGLAFLCGLIVLRFRALWATLLSVSLCIVYFLAAFFLFDHGIMLNMLYPPIAVIGTFVSVNLYNVTCERSEKMEITRTFGRYISPPVVDKILSALGEGELELGGTEHEMTVMFADVRGFTGISEKTNSEEVVRALNVYLTMIIEAVLEYGGMINKFGGDSVMAIWNVPVECEGHALSAIKAAVSAQRAISALQDKGTTLPKMEFGIGINTGKAVAGNMGSRDRLEYSVIGNAVNSAARLAGATPGGKVWIGGNTFDRAKDYITGTPLKSLWVKGKGEPIQAFEVVNIHNWQTDDCKGVISKFVNASVTNHEGCL